MLIAFYGIIVFYTTRNISRANLAIAELFIFPKMSTKEHWLDQCNLFSFFF